MPTYKFPIYIYHHRASKGEKKQPPPPRGGSLGKRKTLHFSSPNSENTVGSGNGVFPEGEPNEACRPEQKPRLFLFLLDLLSIHISVFLKLKRFLYNFFFLLSSLLLFISSILAISISISVAVAVAVSIGIRH